MNGSTCGEHENFKGLSRNEQLLVALFRKLPETDQSHILRIMDALAELIEREPTQ